MITFSAVIRRGYADVGSGQVHYRWAGNTANPIVVLLHQSPSSSAMYEALMVELAGQFYVVAPDTPGFGQSDPIQLDRPVTITDYAAVVGQFIAQLNRPVVLFGHHTGAAIAAQIAADNPTLVQKLALSGPTLLNEQQRKNLPGMASPFPLQEDGQHLQQMWQRLRGKDASAELTLSQRELLLAFTCGENYSASYEAVSQHAFADLLPRIKCPTLVYAATGDGLAGSVAPTLELLANGRGYSGSLPGKTYVCEQHAQQVAEILQNFIVK